MARSVASIAQALSPPGPSAGVRAAPSHHWAAPAWWAAQIDAALTTPDPTLSNVRITLAHYELSQALHGVLGADSGANFHTWAVWGSKKAGSSIRQEDMPHLRRTAALLGGGLGGGVGVFSTWGRVAARRLLPRLAAAGGRALGGGTLARWAQHTLDTTSRAILGGNRTVLDDIGRATACFVATFLDHPAPDPARLATFLTTLRPGPAAQGGQDLLKAAFTHYYQARLAPTLRSKHEHMLLANLNAILHEHWRLQPYIARAIPRLTRRWVTAHRLRFQLGAAWLNAHDDVPPAAGSAPPGFPATLAHLENPDLRRFLRGRDGWDRTPDRLVGSRARDWTDIRDRMNYICALFRSRHCDPTLFWAPYHPAQCADAVAGRVPTPPL